MADLINQNLDNFEFNETSFQLVQEEKKIYDQKFETKPTTYFKDALKRFAKNKSSVAGAIIIGILVLLAIFVPIVSTAEIKDPRMPERFLEPKLFEAGTGFWDGTKKVEGIVYDTINNKPADYEMRAITNLVVDSNKSYINRATPYGVGGSFMFINETKNPSPTDFHTKYLHSYPITMTADGGYKAEIKFLEENYVNESLLGEYAIKFRYKETTNDEEEYKFINVLDFTTEYNDIVVDFSSLISDAGLTEVYSASLYFELKAGEGIKTYILFKNLIFTSNDGNKDLESLSIKDATKTNLLKKDESNQFPVGYWTCSGEKSVYKSEVTLCSFTYDTYEAAYGIREVTVAKSDFQDYINKGWCSYDFSVGPSSFVKLSDKCPIVGVSQQLTNSIGKVRGVVGEVYKYRDLGYDAMPKFIFGTDSQGHDLLTKVFAGLSTSLLLGFCTAAFCFLFGLVWGAISGYFGGNVDLFMERFCEILGGIPFIVVITLAILHLGNNFVTYAMALCLTGWMGTAARTRTQFYRFKGREYVLASRTLGSSDMRLIFRHILPNALGTIVTGAVLMITSTIYSEASLSYLNLGLQGTQSFGVMLSENQKYLEQHTILVLFPAAIMALLMISFNLFGNGLRDALNPSLKGSD